MDVQICICRPGLRIRGAFHDRDCGAAATVWRGLYAYGSPTSAPAVGLSDSCSYKRSAGHMTDHELCGAGSACLLRFVATSQLLFRPDTDVTPRQKLVTATRLRHSF